jgi:hypothetical protein
VKAETPRPSLRGKRLIVAKCDQDLVGRETVDARQRVLAGISQRRASASSPRASAGYLAESSGFSIASEVAQGRDFRRHQFPASHPSYEQQAQCDQRSNRRCCKCLETHSVPPGQTQIRTGCHSTCAGARCCSADVSEVMSSASAAERSGFAGGSLCRAAGLLPIFVTLD